MSDKPNNPEVKAETEEKKGSFLGLVPLLIFLVVYFIMGIGTGDFGNFPLMIGMFLAMAIALVIKKPGGDTLTFGEKVDLFCEGGGDNTLILMIIIYMLAGAFYGVAGAMGATTTQGCQMKDKFRVNFLMVLPAVIVTCIIFMFFHVDPRAVNAGGEWHFVNLLPYICIIVLSLMGVNVVLAMGGSVILGAIIGIVKGDFGFVESFGIIHEGMTWMEDMAVIAILVGGVIALMKYYGGIDWLIKQAW